MHPVEYASSHGHIRVSEPAPGVFLSEIQGRGTVGVVGTIIHYGEQMLGAGRRLLVFHDWELMNGYDAEAKKVLTDWTQRITPYWDGSHILFASPIIAMAVSVAGLTMRGKLVSYSSRKSFERAFAQACAAHGVFHAPVRAASDRPR